MRVEPQRLPRPASEAVLHLPPSPTPSTFPSPSHSQSAPLPHHAVVVLSDDDDSGDCTPFIPGKDGLSDVDEDDDDPLPSLPSTHERVASYDVASSPSSSSSSSLCLPKMGWQCSAATFGVCLLSPLFLLACVSLALSLTGDRRLLHSLQSHSSSLLHVNLSQMDWLQPGSSGQLPACEPHSRLKVASVDRSDQQPSLLLQSLDTLLVQQCLGWGVDPVEPIDPASSSDSSSSSSSYPSTCVPPPPPAPTSALTLPSTPLHLTCNLSPSSLMSTFFPSELLTYPGVLTHLPNPSCDTGVYVVIDEPYRDGMGNHLWSYAMAVSYAMAMNATVVHDDFHASHAETEGMRMREAVFRFEEWEVSREWWDRCTVDSSVRRNEVWVDYMHFDFNPLDPILAETRAKVRALQVGLAQEAGTAYMNASLEANTTYSYLDAETLSYAQVSLPRVDFISPGVTVRFKGIRLTHDFEYKEGLYPPSLHVSRVLEMRYLSQQDGWRKRLFPKDLEDLDTQVAEGKEEGAEVANVQRPLRSWRTSDRIHVAVPVRRGDVTAGTAGKELNMVLDLRHRVVTDDATMQLLAQLVNLTRALPSFNLSSSTSPTQLAGPDVLSRMLFTVYSEGKGEDFITLVQSIRALGLRDEQVRLQLGGRTSWTFNLMVESDVQVLAPSSFSYAAACYFNTESLKVGSGWSWGRFWACRNFVFAPWTRYTPNNPGTSVWSMNDLPHPQRWRMDNETDFQERLVRLVQRKAEQRRRLEPIVVDNYRPDYPPQWLYARREQHDQEIVVST